MDPRFIATPKESEIEAALALWPELAGQHVRPILVTAFGDIFVEQSDGSVLVVAPMELASRKVASSVDELREMFDNNDFASEHLITDLVHLAEERGLVRESAQVFAAAPHPAFTGQLLVEHLMPMGLRAWHSICVQIKLGA
jgi:hypothetical protein